MPFDNEVLNSEWKTNEMRCTFVFILFVSKFTRGSGMIFRLARVASAAWAFPFQPIRMRAFHYVTVDSFGT